MGYTYTPTYYSGLQDTIASVCKSIFSRRGRRLIADQARGHCHADTLKWQQDSFHRILHLAALHREGIVLATDIQAFRASVLAALASPPAPFNPDHLPVWPRSGPVWTPSGSEGPYAGDGVRPGAPLMATAWLVSIYRVRLAGGSHLRRLSSAGAVPVALASCGDGVHSGGIRGGLGVGHGGVSGGQTRAIRV